MKVFSITGGSDCNVWNEIFAMKLKKIFHWINFYKSQDLKISHESTFARRVHLCVTRNKLSQNGLKFAKLVKVSAIKVVSDVYSSEDTRQVLFSVEPF